MLSSEAVSKWMGSNFETPLLLVIDVIFYVQSFDR